jgi:hypothetical protein
MIQKLKICLLLLMPLAFSSCCKPDPAIEDVSEKMKAYFVNYKEGTRWVYLDTITKNIYDTITLKNITEQLDKGSKDVHYRTYVLEYEASKTRSFKITVSSASRNRVNVKVAIDPFIYATGAVTFGNEDGQWSAETVFYDSLRIYDENFYDIIQSQTNNTFHYLVSIAKDIGIVHYLYDDQNIQTRFSGVFKLIKKIES